MGRVSWLDSWEGTRRGRGAVRTLFAHAQGEGVSETALKAALGPRYAVPPTCGMLFHLHIAPVVVSSSQKRELKLGMIHEHG